MKKIRYTLLLAIFSMGINAQTIVSPANGPEDGLPHGMTITFKDGTQQTYTTDEVVNVTYLPDLGMKVYLKG